MPLTLSSASIPTDFPEIMSLMWSSYSSPPQPFFHLYCPLTNNNLAASLQASTTRMLEQHRTDPHARWLKVVDSSTQKIVGAAWYKVYSENPFAHPEDEEEEEVDWYPDDSSREYVRQAITQMERPRREKARRPHVFLNILFTDPEFRGRGVGAMLLQWGIDTARRMGVEFWLDATPEGKPLYEKMGFELVERNPLVPRVERPDQRWREMEEEFGGIVFWTMWLPKEGEVGRRPWEE